VTSSLKKIYYGPSLETEVSKNTILEAIKNSKIKIIIGTQSLIQETVSFAKLGLVVIDEQHRFGVGQRATLVKDNNKINEVPHLLSMSATPIPRTLSLTIFGDLDISIIDELPSGRQPIITKIVTQAARSKAYEFIRSQIKNGRQAFFICPRIEASEENNQITSKKQSLWAEVKNVTEEYEKLSKQIFPELKITMLHGKMKPKEKEFIMQEFNEGKSNILVATSVIEVGIDIPNSTIMLIEGADRFGLAQLYQFRGRVGRGAHQSFCFLFTDSLSDSTTDRLKALIEAKNGFELAEKDLEIRGPGEFIGQKQTGLPDLAMKALKNIKLVKNARTAAEEILSSDPELIKYPALITRLQNFEKTIHSE
jgi:ATP-dependent DNA helicase RecG